MFSARDEKETLAMIVSTFFSFKDREEAFYKRFADNLGGFPGINGFLIDASDAFIDWERKMTGDDWIDTVEDYVDYLLNIKRIPNRKTLLLQAFNVLREHEYTLSKEA